jgi:accessory colonization factor AcfC
MSNATQGLRVVGPGGPYEAMVECAEAFARRRNVPVEVIKGPPGRWLDRRADLIYGGFPMASPASISGSAASATGTTKSPLWMSLFHSGLASFQPLLAFLQARRSFPLVS